MTVYIHYAETVELNYLLLPVQVQEKRVSQANNFDETLSNPDLIDSLHRCPSPSPPPPSQSQNPSLWLPLRLLLDGASFLDASLFC